MPKATEHPTPGVRPARAETAQNLTTPGAFPGQATAFVWPDPNYRPPPQPLPFDLPPKPELSRRRVIGWLTGTAAAGAALVLAGPVAELAAAEPGGVRAESDLTAIAAEFCRQEASFQDQPYPGAKHGTPENERNEERSRLLCEAQDALMERAAAIEAKTAVGVRAKAQMVAAFFGNDWPEEGCAIGTLLRSAVEDAAGVRDGVA